MRVNPDSQKHISGGTQPVAIVIPHQKNIKPRAVTFTCAACLKSVTQERFPGRLPSYCSEDCRLATAAERKRLSRATTGETKGRQGRTRRMLNKQDIKQCITKNDAVSLAIDAIQLEGGGLWQMLAREDFHLAACEQVGEEWEIKIGVHTPAERQPWLYTLHIDERGVVTGFLWDVGD